MPSPSLESFAVLVAIGRGQEEIDRAAALLDSIRAYEPAGCGYFVMVDGGVGRDLTTAFQFPRGCTPASVPHLRREHPERAPQTFKSKGICAAIQQGLRWIGINARDIAFTLKVDTDALVIAPFAEQIAGVFRDNPDVGTIGAYDRTPNGDLRDISGNARIVEQMFHSDTPSLEAIRRHIGIALEKGYRFGEHCLGGAYAISQELPRRMLEAHFLDEPVQ